MLPFSFLSRKTYVAQGHPFWCPVFLVHGVVVPVHCVGVHCVVGTLCDGYAVVDERSKPIWDEGNEDSGDEVVTALASISSLRIVVAFKRFR